MVKTTVIDRMLALIFPKKTLDRQLMEELDNHIKLAEMTKAAIRRRQFDLHITLHHIDALKSWTDGNLHPKCGDTKATESP